MDDKELEQAKAAVKAAVEEVARNAERDQLRRSPFHLQACGGCGAPAFQQPCSLCGYYPMGAHKGHWHPEVATFDHFEKMVTRSGPSRTNGTIATWHAREIYRGRPNTEHRAEAAVLKAAESEMPSIETVWEVITQRRENVFREGSPHHVYVGWNGFDELKSLVEGSIGRGAPEFLPTLKPLLHRWVSAVHEDDNERMSEALTEGVELCRHLVYVVDHKGNLNKAQKDLQEALDRMPSLSVKP